MGILPINRRGSNGLDFGNSTALGSFYLNQIQQAYL